MVLLFSLGGCSGEGSGNETTKRDTTVAAIPYPLTKDADSLVLLLQLTGKDTHRVNVLNGLTWALGRNFPDSSIAYGDSSIVLARELGFMRGLGRAMHNVGWSYLLKGDYDTATAYVQRALAIFIKENDLKGQFSAYNSLGGINTEQGNYNKALESYLEARRLAEATNNVRAQLATITNAGLIYNNTGKYDQAIAAYREAIALCLETGEQKILATSYLNMGKVYGDRKQLDSSLFYNKKALELKTAENDRPGMATALINIGQVYYLLGDHKRAIENDEAAYRIQQETGDKNGSAVTLLGISELKMAAGDARGALAQAQEALAMARSMGAKDLSMKALSVLAELYAKSGDYKKAYEYQGYSAALRDSLLNETSDRNMAELQTKYETEKKDKEIELLNTNNALQQSEIDKATALADKQGTQRNAFIAGFVLVLALAGAIFLGLRQKQKANRVLAQQNAEIEEKNKNITDSINYARRIQRALLTSEAYLRAQLPEYFILNKPKDIVSGDFYWAMRTDDGKLFLATADCTGHGVPGAFMSLIGISLLNEIVNGKKIRSTGKVLDQLRDDIIRALNPEGAEEVSSDGMDIALCCYDFKNRTVEYAGANNPLYVVSSGGLQEYEPDRAPVGKHTGEEKPFRVTTIPLYPGDLVCAFSDGFADQFGGPSGKKFKYRQLKKVLQQNAHLPMQEQKEKLNAEFESWRGNLEQVDDVLIVAVRIP